MKRWLCLSAAVSVLILSGCNDDDKKAAAKKAPAHAAAAPASPALGYAASPDLMPRATQTADALTGAAAETGDNAGRHLFDGQALNRAGFELPDQTSPVFVPPGPAKAPPTLTASRGRSVTDLGRMVPDISAAADPSRTSLLAGTAGTVLKQFVAFEESCYTEIFPGISRADWGAAPRRNSPIAMRPTHVTVHHTEGPQTMTADATERAVKNIQSYHMQNSDGRHGWDDIGYHFLIDGAGRVVEGRPTETLGAHAGGANQDNIGISVMGDFNHQRPTDAQVESLTRLVSFLALKYRQDPARNGFLEPHRHYNNTDCPGKNMMAILDALRQRINVQTVSLEARMAKAAPGQFVPALVTNA
jgi:hypothetical protein